MILTLKISRLPERVYTIDVLAGDSPVVDDRTVHPSIADAIRHFATDVPDGFAPFLEVRYSAVSDGTWATEDLVENAEAIAARLAAVARPVNHQALVPRPSTAT